MQYFYRPQRSCGKVIFSQVCVKNSVQGVSASVHARRYTPHGQTSLRRHPPGQIPPNGHCSRRYASYWNAFWLFKINAVNFT